MDKKVYREIFDQKWKGIRPQEPLMTILLKQTEMDLSFMELTELPDWFCELKSLTKLWLYNNELSILPDNFGNLKSLVILDLFNNHLLTLPDSIGNITSLAKLYLGENKLTTLPASISNLKCLEELTLHDNMMTKVPIVVLHLKLNLCKVMKGNPIIDVNIVVRKRETIFQQFLVILSVLYLYIDVASDIYAAFIFFIQGRVFFGIAQVLFSTLPLILHISYIWNTESLWEILLTILMLRPILEAYRSIKFEVETATLVNFKKYEAFLEGVPSAILQLYFLIKTEKIDLILGISIFSSLSSIAYAAFYFYPRCDADKWADRETQVQVSKVLRFILSFADVTFRIITCVALFVAVQYYGIILLSLSILMRIAIMADDKLISGLILTVSYGPVLTKLKGTNWNRSDSTDAFDYRPLIYAYYSNIIDFILATVMLYKFGNSIDDLRKGTILFVLISALFVQIVLIWDRFGTRIFLIHKCCTGTCAIRLQERRYILNSCMSSFEEMFSSVFEGMSEPLLEILGFEQKSNN
jgi:hypothetical protein